MVEIESLVSESRNELVHTRRPSINDASNIVEERVIFSTRFHLLSELVSLGRDTIDQPLDHGIGRSYLLKPLRCQAQLSLLGLNVAAGLVASSLRINSCLGPYISADTFEHFFQTLDLLLVGHLGCKLSAQTVELQSEGVDMFVGCDKVGESVLEAEGVVAYSLSILLHVSVKLFDVGGSAGDVVAECRLPLAEHNGGVGSGGIERLCDEGISLDPAVADWCSQKYSAQRKALRG
jgi:hypothetical protein